MMEEPEITATESDEVDAPFASGGGCVGRTVSGVLQLCGILFILGLLAMAAGGFYCYRWATHKGPMPPDGSKMTQVHVIQGDSLRTIANRLEKGWVINRPSQLFLVLAYCRGTDRQIRPGHYNFPAGISPMEAFRVLAKGPDTQLGKVTFPEGYTTEQMAARLVEQKLIKDADRFESLCSDAAFLKKIKCPVADVNGLLFPDTYQFDPPMDEGEVVRQMSERFFDVTRELHLLPGMNSPNAYPLTFQQYVVLASIIEREAADPAEMPMIASVYHNRLQQKMRLESCSTVRYALNKWDAPLTMEDLKTNSPYNTYESDGLPPSPICNPGRNALSAAFRPDKSDFLFYVYGGNGHHIFSKSLKEHEAARQEHKESWAFAGQRKKEAGAK